MASNLRKAKLAALLQSAIAKYFLEHQRDWNLSATVLVDEVMVAEDLKSAKVWLGFSPYNAKTAASQFKEITQHARELQGFLFKQMHARRAPQITLLQSNPEQQFKLEQIFDTLKSHDRGKDQTDSNGIEEDSAGSTS